jgi:hypothetical protein
VENELYKTSRKRTNTENSEKILFQTLKINPAEAQLMVICREILGIYLAKMLIHKYFSSIDTSMENPLITFFNDISKMDEEFFVAWPSSTKAFDDVVQFIIKIAWNLAKMDKTIAKEKYGDGNFFAIEKVHGIEMCIGAEFQKTNHIC